MAQNSQKAFLQTEKGDNIPCLFNPTELSFSRSNCWQAPDMPGKGVPTLNYSGANSGSMTLRLFFDSTDDGTPVTNYTDQLLAPHGNRYVAAREQREHQQCQAALGPVQLGQHALVQGGYSLRVG